MDSQPEYLWRILIPAAPRDLVSFQEHYHVSGTKTASSIGALNITYFAKLLKSNPGSCLLTLNATSRADSHPLLLQLPI